MTSPPTLIPSLRIQPLALPPNYTTQPARHAPMTLPILQLLPGKERSVERGHLWVFSGALAPKNPQPHPHPH